MWSDVRFLHAHALYDNRGYRIFSSRILDDPDRIVEYGMSMDIQNRPPEADPLTKELKESIKMINFNDAEKNPDLMHKIRYVGIVIYDPRKFLSSKNNIEQKEFDIRLLFVEVREIKSDEIKIFVGSADTPIGFFHQIAGGIFHPACFARVNVSV